jgi:hypothetical protein
MDGPRLKGAHVERKSTPPEHSDDDAMSPLLPEALAALGLDHRQAVIQVTALCGEFPAWAVWLPRGGRPWTAVRPASARAPGPEVPMIWVRAATVEELTGQMQRADAQLTPS